jgi:hypothetical protein
MACSDREFESHERMEWETPALLDAVRVRLSEKTFRSYVSIADDLNSIPWDVLAACRQLVRMGVAREGSGKNLGRFGIRGPALIR